MLSVTCERIYIPRLMVFSHASSLFDTDILNHTRTDWDLEVGGTRPYYSYAQVLVVVESVYMVRFDTLYF